MTALAGGSADPVYELWAVRRNRETGVVEQIVLSREAVFMYRLEEHEWRPSKLQVVDDAHKIVRKPKTRTPRRPGNVMPDGERDQLDYPWNQELER
jgi:hypothetical protein